MNRRLRSLLRQRGAAAEEITRAEHDSTLAVLVLERTLMPGRARYTFAEACRRASFDVTTAKRLWRALGFPDPPERERRFTDDDVDAMITLRRQMGAMLSPVDEGGEELAQNVRVIGAALARIAEVVSDSIVTAVRSWRDAGRDDEEIATELSSVLDWERLSRLTDYALRLQLRASVRRKLTASDPTLTGAEDAAVGFVDLVGYTALSQELDPLDLGALVTRFEELAYDTVAEHAGRVVKTIGDEVMFVAGDVGAAARIALRLTERSAVDELLPEARAGLSYGSVLAQEGDYYGPVVNLASRLVEMARPGTVLVSSDVRDALEPDPTFAWHRMRSRRIRDIGRVEVWALQRAREEVTEPGASGT